MARDGEGYCSFSGTTASKAGDESTVGFFFFFHIFWMSVPISQGRSKEGRDSTERCG